MLIAALVATWLCLLADESAGCRPPPATSGFVLDASGLWLHLPCFAAVDRGSSAHGSRRLATVLPGSPRRHGAAPPAPTVDRWLRAGPARHDPGPRRRPGGGRDQAFTALRSLQHASNRRSARTRRARRGGSHVPILDRTQRRLTLQGSGGQVPGRDPYPAPGVRRRTSTGASPWLLQSRRRRAAPAPAERSRSGAARRPSCCPSRRESLDRIEISADAGRANRISR